ncbi:MAG: dihydropteroate synthase [Hydrogenibacillus schlegelii]|uniref:Dihydropteroate synthase n=1 Tax=Hydrogenibacillus schlegelii TaxID=1484 RepID=A0A947CYT2_HYDSH|nr:dihydropteroate synthase [Hydrogenibacillus schlegelii]
MRSKALSLPGGRRLLLDRPIVMGILNVTPDSFSDGGRYTTVERALEHARAMVACGAAIIDVGGESTRPGHTPVPAEEELRRVLPVLRALRAALDVPISIDTSKPAVAEAALAAGADILNDIWGLQDPAMARLAAEAKVPVVIMHNRREPEYSDLLGEIRADLLLGVERLLQAGGRDEQVILDPGIGFGKTYAQNLAVLKHLPAIVDLGPPVLLGASRKSVIGLTLDLPVDRRLAGSLAVAVYGVLRGVAIVRAHDVCETVQALKMVAAIEAADAAAPGAGEGPIPGVGAPEPGIDR